MKTNFEIKKEIEDKFTEWRERMGLVDVPIMLYIDSMVGPRLWGQAGVDEDESREEEERVYYVSISMKFMARMPEEIEETVVHELAHISVVVDGVRESSHGRYWQQTMRKFGWEPTVSKRFDRESTPVWGRSRR